MNYRNWVAFAALASSGATLSSCAQNNTTSPVNTENIAPVAVGTGAHDESGGMGHGSSVHTHSTRLLYSSAPASIQAGKPATMTLQIVDKKTGKPINDFETVHDKKLHFIVVSDDLQFFTHIHPKFVGNGKFEITTTLPRNGRYRLYADYKPQGKEGEVALQEITVGDAKPTSSTRLTPDVLRNGWMVKNVASHDEGLEPTKNATRYNVALMPMPAQIEAGKDVMLHFQVRDAAGKPLSKLEPYLGARGHCVILSSDPKTYLHTHPLDANHSMSDMKMGDMKMSEDHGGQASAQGSDVMFHTNFPAAGTYKIWGQFKHNGKIVSAPFVVNVGAAKPNAKAAATETSSTRNDVAIPANAQKISIELPEGYKNGAATVKVGMPVALTFTLKSDAGCGNTIVVPDADNWSKTLEVGQSATVVYTPTKSGTLAFMCGMNMYKGSVVVQ